MEARALPPLPVRGPRHGTTVTRDSKDTSPRSSNLPRTSPTPPPRSSVSDEDQVPRLSPRGKAQREESEVIIQKSPRNWRVSETNESSAEEPPMPPPRSPRRTATESAVMPTSLAPKELPPARRRIGTQYRPKLSADRAASSGDGAASAAAARAAAAAKAATDAARAAKEPQFVISDATKHRVKAYKQFLFEYYSGWFKYLNQRKARTDKLDREMRLMPGDSGQAHKQEHARKESQYLRQRRRKMRLGEFQLLALLGKGAFGAVYLARKRDTGEVVAVKKISKQQYDASNKDRVMREKKVLQVAAQNPWLVGLSYAFQDKEFLYLAMEYVPGGDLRGLLRNIGCLDETMACFYLVEMIACVEALHALGYTHRDLKPDNFLIGQSGHLKLGDFGLSKEGLELQYKETLSTFRGGLQVPKELDFGAKLESYRANQEAGKAVAVVGSPDYMAVEILRGAQYNFSVDWWSIGVIFYEMLAGLPPFYAPSPVAIFGNILDYQNTLVFPELTTGAGGEEEGGEEEAQPCMSAEAWRLIRAFLTEPSARLGRDGAAQIKRHKYFANVEWGALLAVEPPFVPELEGEADSSYFVCAEEDDAPPPRGEADDGGGAIVKDPNFLGFTYKPHLK